jgi:hypothetical protein
MTTILFLSQTAALSAFWVCYALAAFTIERQWRRV